MTSRLEKELSYVLGKIYSEWKKGVITLQEAHDLYFSAKVKYLAAEEEEKKPEASKLILKILFTVGRISEEFVEKWQNSKITPTDKELELLKQGCNEVLEAFDDYLKEELLAYRGKPYDIHYAEVKEKIEKIKNFLDKPSITNPFNSVSDLFIKRAKWERKSFKHFRQVILCCFPWLPALLVLAMFRWWDEIWEQTRATRILLLFVMITFSIVFAVLTYYHWRQLTKCSRKIAEIDRQIAEKLSKSGL